MSEGLEAFNNIKDEMLEWTEGYEEDLDIVEKELKEYEKMKAIKGTTTFDKAIEDTLINACPNVAKKLKALEIIKEKEIDIWLFNISDDFNNYNWSLYLGYHRKNTEKCQLTQEEYNLLKEVLKK